MHSRFILQWSHCKRFTIMIYIHGEWHCVAYCADLPLRIYGLARDCDDTGEGYWSDSV